MAATRSKVLSETKTARAVLTLVALLFLGLCLVLPLVAVFAHALRGGWTVVAAALTDPDAVSALWLTVLIAAVVVPSNALFGLAAGWLLARFRFRGRSLLLTLIDLPFSVSPVIVGLSFVLLYGSASPLGRAAVDAGFPILFAFPGMMLATHFVTFPLVAREVLGVMQEQGSQEEEAALTLGASGWQMFTRVTLPKARWGLLFGLILCNARAMGEFGAVSVVSGHIRGRTNTLPLHIEILYNEYQLSAAFAVSSLVVLLALVTLLAKRLVDWRLGP